MKALTLWQPWASLIAVGAKTIETRSWPTSYRGQLAIHAGKTPAPARCWPQPDAMPKAITSARSVATSGVRSLPGDACRLPLGAIVATAELVDVVPINADHRYDLIGFSPYHDDWPEGHEWAGRGWGLSKIGGSLCVTRSEMAVGDFASDRWAWLLDDIRPTTERCPACWGSTDDRSGAGRHENGSTGPLWLPDECHTCEGTGRCDPIPAKGRQGLWSWTPEVTRA